MMKLLLLLIALISLLAHGKTEETVPEAQEQAKQSAAEISEADVRLICSFFYAIIYV